MAAIQVTKDNIDKLLEENGTVILDFWANWCGPCRGFAPVFEAASEQYGDVVFGKVDIDVEPDLAARYNVRQIPTIVALKNKVVVHTQVGALPGSLFTQFVDGIETLA